jgi:hypothetical protein
MKIIPNKIVFAMAILCLSVATSANAQQPVIPLYTGVAPGSENAKQKEVSFVNPDKQTRIRNVTRPTLTAYLPEGSKANGTAIIVAPGGGFMHLAMEKEGTDMARWLQARGVAAFGDTFMFHSSVRGAQRFGSAAAPGALLKPLSLSF